MDESRLHALSDGIFAIGMTLLVFDIKISPVDHLSNAALWQALKDSWPVFYSFITSFALLYTYWRAHNALLNTFIKKLDTVLVQLNMLFLMLISLIPFSTRILGQYYTIQLGIGVYALNVALISFCLFSIRTYGMRAQHIETSNSWKRRDHRNAIVRTLLPPFICILALGISFFSTTLALAMITFIAFLNVFSAGFEPIFKLLDAFSIGTD